MFPVLYDKNEVNFEHNGQGILADATSAYAEEELNGKCEITITYPVNGRHFDVLGEESIIKAKSNEMQEPQLFRVYNDTKKHVDNAATVRAKHITNDFSGNFVEKLEIKNANGTQAMANVFSSLSLATKFKGYSNVTAVSSTLLERQQALACIAGTDGSLLDHWGGEIERDNFTIKLLQRRGRDNAARIAYRKNLKALDAETSTDNVITRIFPFATINGANGTTLVTLKEKFVISPLEKNYAFVRIMPVDFSSDEAVKDEASLRNASKNYFSGKKIDQPLINMKIDFARLWKLKAYAEFQSLERVVIGDTVHVYHPKFKMEITAKVVRVKYNIITGVNEEVELGSIKADFMDKLRDDVKSKVDQLPTKDWANDLVNKIAEDIQGINGGSIYTFPPRRPHTTYYLDTDNINTAKNIMVMNYNGIAFSKNGINGPWKTGWSIDGVFVADWIQTGTLKSGLVEVSFNGISDSIRITGTALEALSNNIRVMQLNKNGLQFWNGGTSLGTMGTTGKMALDGVSGFGTDFTGKAMFIDLAVAEFFQLSNKNGSGLYFGKEGRFNTVSKHKDGWAHFGEFAAGRGTGNLPIFFTDGNTLYVSGNLAVEGNKHAVVKIGEEYRALYAYETAESYFGDIGESTTNDNGEIEITMESIFLNTVNTSMEYHVFLSSYANSNVWVDSRTSDSFIVKSDKPNIRFAWEVKAKRTGFEKERLEVVEEIPRINKVNEKRFYEHRKQVEK
ncbi:phage tail spike protein [Listeria booriae]|uniref:phage tail spike protein n=1 Tax=Listeria booriae TaxID=1552123 RepID=UPI001628FD42|nr:phage tail spike protein [Listeria booriae]MBC2106154.1 hypothetical protein [Listeria booriae]